MNNVILIGMPGSGKSTVGVLLAKLLGYAFVDSDLLIQQAAGKKLYQILQEDGDERFAELENRVNAQLCVEHTVIATGGSIVYCEQAMAHLKSIGTVVFLDVAPDELIRRVGDYATRGILMRAGETYMDLYRARLPLYRRYADITVPCAHNSLMVNAESIVTALTAYAT